MADAPAPSKGFDLTQKLGPLPLWAWLGAGIGIWWYLQRQQTAAASASQAANQQTDPAGNVGSIDPSSGYVYGTPEDLAALAANNGGTSSTGTSAGTNATTGGQKYADNNSWGIAAVNYLVGLGIDATTANQAVQNYLSSQPLTTAEQGDINLVLASPIGAPPSLPGPVSTNPTPVTTPGGGTATTGPEIIMSLPDGSGGWEQVTFPNQAAVDAWNQWNANFAADHGGRTQAYRSEWNTELTSLGAVGTNGPLKPPSTVTGNPYDAM